MTDLLRYFRGFSSDQIVRVTTYAFICVGAVALWISKSPAMTELLDWVYFPWVATYAVSSVVLLFSAVAQSKVAELFAIPLTAAGTFTYVLAVYLHPPYGKPALGVAAGSLLMVGVIVLTSRFLFIYSGKRVI